MNMLRIAIGIILAFIALPVFAGMIGTALPAFGYAPSLGTFEFSTEPFRELFQTPGFPASLWLTLLTGTGATLISLVLAACCCAMWLRRPFFQKLIAFTAPFLATPHGAFAIGFGFLIAPSGLLIRAAAQVLGWERPPDFIAPHDPYGISLVLGLVAKEFPYLLLMMGAALHHMKADDLIKAASALGYHPVTAFFKCVFPLLQARLRLPVYAVLAFSLSNVESALLLGPGHPPSLSLLAHRWFSDYDLALYRPAAAASLLLMFLIIGMIGLWHGVARGVLKLILRWAEQGQRGGLAPYAAKAAGCAAALMMAMFVLSLASLGMWSFALVWRFPDLLPSLFTLQNWVRLFEGLSLPFFNTLVIAGLSSGVALMMSLIGLEAKVQSRSIMPSFAIIYASLFIPPIAFLFGLQNLLLRLGWEGTYLAVIAIHIVFVLPYVFLSLSGPFLKLDRRYRHVAASCGSSPIATFFHVVMPLLIRPVMVSFAVGFAVSAGLYLPTLYSGAGRITTLTTEAVTLASGLDRRVIGVYAFAQAALPCLVYWAALVYPHRVKRL
jgi:putative thiamine transport system permease protein